MSRFGSVCLGSVAGWEGNPTRVLGTVAVGLSESVRVWRSAGVGDEPSPRQGRPTPRAARSPRRLLVEDLLDAAGA
jgi:hypothetical protein